MVGNGDLLHKMQADHLRHVFLFEMGGYGLLHACLQLFHVFTIGENRCPNARAS